MVYSINFNMSGIFLLIFVYAYLYILYRERYMGIWLVSWIIYFLRSFLMDAGMFNWMQTSLGIVSYQILSSIATLMFMYGTLQFVNKKFNMYWLYGAIGTLLMSMTFTILKFSFLYAMLPATWFCGIVYIWVGIIFIRYLELSRAGKLITGYTFILLGIHTLNKPFLVNISWITSWGYLIADDLRLIIAVGTLLVYFEKNRMDLSNKETQYRLLAENAVDIVYRYKLLPKAHFDYISPSIFTVTGYSDQEFYSNPDLLYSLIDPNDTPLFQNFINIQQSTEDIAFAFPITHKNGNIVWLEHKFSHVYDKEGRVLAREGIFRDITTRKNLEQMTMKLEKLNIVGQMAVNIAHEIRNPLTTVYGYLQFLKNKKEECVKYKEQFAIMTEELNKANVIISEYLLLARNKRVELKNSDLNKLINQSYPLLQVSTGTANIQVKLDLADIPNLHIDENEIRQLLINLVRNGVEAMPSGGNITIRTFLENDKIVLAITDQGAGIPTNVLENMGTPFLTTKADGTGLGLPICYQIVNRHNAVMEVSSNVNGTTFFVRFKINSDD